MIRESTSWVTVLGSGGDVVATVAVLAVLALAVALAAPRSRALVAAAGVSLAVVLGMTVVPTGGWGRFALTSAWQDSIAANLAPRPGDLTAWAHASDGPPNVALFVPLGLFLALLLRRPALAAAAAVVLSVAIECYQASLTTRVGSLADVVANGLGALLGAGLAAVALTLLPQARHAVRAEPAR